MSLRSLPPLLRNEPAMARVIGASNATLAVATPAQAFVLAGLIRLGTRRPVLVITPTGAAADQLAHDLEAFTGGGRAHRRRSGRCGGSAGVEVFPAWETLPFERVSPDVATMGRRLRLLWQLGGGTSPRRPSRPRASWWPRSRRCSSGWARGAPRPDRWWWPQGTGWWSRSWSTELVAMGYRRESIVEHRGELAVRGGIVDVFPSTADEPVRIDLWGDEVDRLTRFDVSDQRSIDDLGQVELFGCRELVVDETMRKRAAGLVGSAPWGRHQWDRLADGDQFDGMESWLPVAGRLRGADHRPVGRRTPWWCWSSPAGSATGPASCSTRSRPWPTPWPPPGDWTPAPALPACTSPSTACWPGRRPEWSRWCPPAEGPDIPLVESRGWEPILGDGAKLASQVSTLVGDGYSVVLCSSTPGGAERLSGILAEEGVTVPVVARSGRRGDPAVDLTTPGARIVVAPSTGASSCPGPGWRCWPSPTSPAGAVPTARPGPGPDPVDGFFDDLAPGSYVVHRQHGVAKYGGMVTRTMGGATRDYLLLEYRGDDKLYLPTDQIELLTPYAGGDSPAVSRLGGSEWQRARSKARAAVHEIAEELVALYRRRLQVTGHAFGPDTPWQAELESSFPVRRAAFPHPAPESDGRALLRLLASFGAGLLGGH